MLWNNRLINLEMISEFFPAKEDQIIHFVSLIEQGLQIKYSAESFKLLVVLLKFTIARINNYSSSINIDNKALTDTSEYSLIKKIIPRKWVSSDEDIQWITLIFLSSNIYKSNLEISEDNIIRKLIEKMVESFELRTLINIDKKDDFVNRLYTHIRPAIYRIKFGLSLERYNVKSIINEQKHSILLSLIKDLIKPIEEFIGKNFPNDELQLLSLYFGGQLEDKNQSINNIKPMAVTVCANGLISSSMLKKTLENLFPEFIFLTAISEREFYDYEEDYNIVFSTTVLETQIPQFSVDTLMSKEDQIRLRYNVLKEFNKLDNVENLNQTVEKVLSIIDKHTIVKDRASLVKDIENVIVTSSNSEKLISNYWNPGLTSYLKSDYITKTDKTMAWEEAVRKAALPLLESNSIKVTYIERIIEMIRNTNYMYLGEWMAIPHAESKGDIIKEAISLLIAEKPIIFPGNKKIKMIVPIAITDTTKHLRAMNELSEISLNPYYIDQLVESSETEIYIKIKEMEKIF